MAALFVATPGQWRQHDWGPPKTGFVLRSAGALAEGLAARGIPVRLEHCQSFDDVPEVVAEAAREISADTVLVNRELPIDEVRRDRAVEARLAEDGVAWRAFDDQTLIPPGAVRTSAGDFYEVFTPFFRNWSKQLEQRGFADPLPAPGSAVAERGEISRAPGYPETGGDSGIADRWPAGEDEAIRRLERFLEERAADYDDARDDPDAEATSTLSPYLAAGCLSARSAIVAASAANEGRLEGGDPGLASWIRQLAWREFYRHVLVGYPRVAMYRPFRRETEAIEWRDDPEGLAAWREGRTGFPIVDAGMRALAETGWLHNRLRMIVASFLAKDLLIDWRLGERHFMESLVDADLANNNGGWQWAASTGTDAAPYFRVFNPWRQSERFDPEGLYVERWVPELQEVDASALHDPKRLAKAIDGIDYPPPIVDHSAARERAIEAFGAIRD